MESVTRAKFLLGTAFCEYKAHLCASSICFGLKWTGWEKAELVKIGSGAVGRQGLGQLPRHTGIPSLNPDCGELRPVWKGTRGLGSLPGDR